MDYKNIVKRLRTHYLILKPMLFEFVLFTEDNTHFGFEKDKCY
jgi:hypothetical protein